MGDLAIRVAGLGKQYRLGAQRERYSTLRDQVTVLIVTPNMHQAARVSDYTAFMYLGELIEFDEAAKIFTNPSKKATEDYITGRYG